MTTSLHKSLLPPEIHQPFSYEYADAAARTGASGFVPEDIGKFARQLDDNSMWMLTAVTPTWKRVDGTGTGETNTASNVGTAGVGVYKQKTGVDLEFKKINAGSAKVSVADDTGNDEVDIDVVTGTTADSVCVGNDSRLSDARDPNAHASSHQHGGSDEVATATPAANAIPKADGSGSLDAWVSHLDLTSSAPEDVTKAVAAAGTATDAARADHKHDISTGLAVKLDASSANTEGVAITLARSDHTHEIDEDGSISNIDPDEVAAPGTAEGFARKDHVHGITTDVAGAIQIGDSAAEGTSGNFSRADHTHGFAAPAAPVNVTKAAAATGTSTAAARADHKHDVTTAVPVATGTSNAEGTAESLARSDHVHALSVHASTHEDGGSDEINVGGLSGVLADPQTPSNHASTHQHGGADEVATATAGVSAIPKADETGVLADGWISESSVTQHEGAIDHNALDNYDIAEHRVINDGGTSTTELWSSSKIDGELSAIVAGIDIKAGVDTTTEGLGDITLSGEQTLNGLLTSSSRVLVTDQAVGSQNGIYVTGAGAWTRATDADEDAEVTNGNVVHVVNSGSTKYKFKYLLVTPDPITVGGTAQTWEEHRDIDFGTTAGTATEGNDSRVPTQDENDALQGTNGSPSGSNRYVTDSDPRMTDARTPVAHATTHQSGGSDAIKLDDLATPDDNTDLDATTARHGLLPKLGGGTSDFLRADGTWAQAPELFDAIVAPTGGDYTSVYAAFNAGHQTVYVRTGTYVETSTIVLPDGAQLFGENGAVIDFNGGSYRIECDGSGGVQEVAGTISVATGSTAVVGIGTSFTSLSPGDFIKIGSSFFEIATITDNLNLVLVKPWRGEAISGHAMLGQSMYRWVWLQNIRVINSAVNGLYLRGILGLKLGNVNVLACTSSNILMEDSYGVNLDQVISKHSGEDGIRINDSYEVTVNGFCHGDNNVAHGLHVEGNCDDIKITHCSFGSNGLSGVYINGFTRNCTLNGVACCHNDGKGIDTGPDTESASLVACVTRYNGGVGIDWDGKDNSIVACTVANNGAGGISGGDHGTITACHIEENTGVGLSLTGGDNGNTITGNHIEDNTGDGVYCTDDNNVFTNNIILSNGGAGVNLTATSDNNRFVNNVISGNTGTDYADVGSGNYRFEDADALPSIPSIRTLGTGSQQACAGNDARLSNARPPTAHATTHSDGGSDEIDVKNLGSTSASGADQLVRSDGAGALLWTSAGTPGTIQPDDTAQAGTATTYSRGDHRHAISADTPGAVTPGNSAAEGTATSFARSDHQHSVPAFAAPGSIEPDDAADEGVATSFARSDHQHAIAAGTPTGVTVGQTTAEGTSTSFARADHVHGTTGAGTLAGLTSEPTGFPNRTDSVTSFVPSPNRRFTIAPAVTSFDFYINGVKFTKSSAETVDLTNTTGLWFIYYDNTGTLQASMTPWSFGSSIAFVATVYWNSAQATQRLWGEERHGLVMDWRTHQYLHTTEGTRYISGFPTSGYVLNTDTDAAVTFGLGNGEIADEDLIMSIQHAASPSNPFEQVLTDPAQIPVLYRDGSGNWVKDAATNFPFKNTTAGRINFNENIGGSTWQQTEAANNDFVAYWLFATNDPNEPIISVQGQREDDTLANARANSGFNSLNLGTLPSSEWKLLYRAIYQTGGGFGGTRKAKLQALDDFRTASLQPGAAAAVAAHSSLTGLGVGNDHPQYQLRSEKSTASGYASLDVTTKVPIAELPTGTPGAIQPDASAAEGSATTLARSDHTHSIAADTPGSIQPDDTAAEGIATSFARSDHKHGVVAAAPSVGIGAGNTEGSATSFARSDHDHKIRETSGPTDLTVGNINDGQIVARVGTALQGLSLTKIPTVQARRTTVQTLTTSWVDVPCNVVDVETDDTVLERDDINTERILVKETGTVFVWGSLSADVTHTDSIDVYNHVRFTKNGTAIPGSEVRGGNHYSSSFGMYEGSVSTAIYAVECAAGDYLAMQIMRSGAGGVGTVFSFKDISFGAMKLKGARGDQGLPGSGSSVTVKSSGTSVPNTPHTTLNFKEGLAATDAGGGQADVIGSLIKTQFAELTANATTTSVTYIDLLSFNYTKQRADTALIIHVTCSASNDSNDKFVRFRLRIDGVAQRGMAFVGQGNEGNTVSLVIRKTGLAVGSRTIALQWLVEANTGQCRPATVDYEHCSILVQEVRV